MSIRTIQAAHAAFANNDPSVLFGAMAPDTQHVYRFEGDRIVTFQQYTDSEQWARLMP